MAGKDDALTVLFFAPSDFPKFGVFDKDAKGVVNRDYEAWQAIKKSMFYKITFHEFVERAHQQIDYADSSSVIIHAFG